MASSSALGAATVNVSVSGANSKFPGFSVWMVASRVESLSKSSKGKAENKKKKLRKKNTEGTHKSMHPKRNQDQDISMHPKRNQRTPKP